MGNRDLAAARTLANEGFYSCDPDDPGGETLYGIARKKNPQWVGWADVDKYRDLPGFPQSMKTDVELKSSAGGFLLANYWFFDGVTDDAVAAKIFDRAVNHGLAGAVSECQHGLQHMVVGPVVVDGKWGPDTEAMVNAAEPAVMLNALRREWILTITIEVAQQPALQKFVRGWVGRALQ